LLDEIEALVGGYAQMKPKKPTEAVADRPKASTGKTTRKRR
jgi:hypothetical protein